MDVLLQVGKLVIRRRCRLFCDELICQPDLTGAEVDIRTAKELEEILLCLTKPEVHDVLNPIEVGASLKDLLQIGEVYRHTGLQQLYRAFPDLLEKRLGIEQSFPQGDGYTNYLVRLQKAQAGYKSSQTVDDWLRDLAIFSLDPSFVYSNGFAYNMVSDRPAILYIVRTQT